MDAIARPAALAPQRSTTRALLNIGAIAPRPPHGHQTIPARRFMVRAWNGCAHAIDCGSLKRLNEPAIKVAEPAWGAFPEGLANAQPSRRRWFYMTRPRGRCGCLAGPRKGPMTFDAKPRVVLLMTLALGDLLDAAVLIDLKLFAHPIRDGRRAATRQIKARNQLHAKS